MYLVASTASPTFPSLGSLAPQFGVSTVLTKMNLTGTALVYSTFFDSDKVPTEPGPASLAIDGAQNVFLTGPALAFQPNLAMAPTTAGTFQPSGLPAGASCTASPASFSFSGAGGTQNVTITFSTTGSAASLHNSPGHRKPSLWWTTASAFGLLLTAGLRNKRRLRGLVALALLAGATSLISCGGGSGGTSPDPSVPTPPGTYSISVAATSGSTSRSAVVILVVR